MPTIRRFTDWRHWLRGLWTAAIEGGCNAVLASLGLAAGFVAGADVHPLELKQTGGVFLSASVIRLMFFLAKNPAPAEVEETIPSDPPFPPTT